MFERETLSEAEVPAARDLFELIIAAEADRLTDEQKADPRKYLLDTWSDAARTIMRPLRQVDELVEERIRHQQMFGKDLDDDLVQF